MANKNLKLTLTTLLSGITILTFTTTFSLTSCGNPNNGDNKEINTNDKAVVYLEENLTRINPLNDNPWNTPSQNPDSDILNAFNDNLKPQNIANAIIQRYLDLEVEGTGSNKKVSVEVEGNEIDATIEYTTGVETLVTTTEVYVLTLVNKKLSGTQTISSSDTLLSEITLTNASLYNVVLINGSEVGLPSTNYYNAIQFGGTTKTNSLVFTLSGNILVEENVYTSTLDTTNIHLLIGTIYTV